MITPEFKQRSAERSTRITAINEECWKLHQRANAVLNEMHTGKISNARHWELNGAHNDILDQIRELQQQERAIRQEGAQDRAALVLTRPMDGEG